MKRDRPSRVGYGMNKNKNNNVKKNSNPMPLQATVSPNQQRALNKLPPELRRRNFVTKHRLSTQIGAKRAKTCKQCVHIPTELPFCKPPLVVGQRFLVKEKGSRGLALRGRGGSLLFRADRVQQNLDIQYVYVLLLPAHSSTASSSFLAHQLVGLSRF